VSLQPGLPGEQGDDGIAWPGPVGPIGLGGATSSTAPTTTGTETALAIPSGTGTLTLYLNNATLLTVQGIAAGIADQLLFVFSKGAGQVDFAHLHASGTALGKLKLFATVGLTSLAAGSGVAVFQYDATVTQWRLVAHEQGSWIAPAYAAGDFTANGTMTWTVDAGDVVQYRYRLVGRTLMVQWELVNTSVGGTPGAALQIAIPAGLLAAGLSLSASLYINELTIRSVGVTATTVVGDTKIWLFNNAIANWALSVNQTLVYGTTIIEVQ